ncbi:hypothetical protein DFH06DRAFT_1151181 [Mycena polygramma]|nr:hypothetical protein DFH06DRAFT_1151181 [Mycena polygramma]
MNPFGNTDTCYPKKEIFNIRASFAKNLANLMIWSVKPQTISLQWSSWLQKQFSVKVAALGFEPAQQVCQDTCRDVEHVVLGQESEQYDLPLEIWAKCVLFLIRDPALSLVQAAAARACVAGASKKWRMLICTEQHRIYTMSEFWSYVTITKDLRMDSLSFTMSKCMASDISIHLLLRNVQHIRGVPATVKKTAKLVDDIMRRITPSSSRWISFKLSNKNPIVFHRLQTLCASVSADALKTLKLSYVYMPGYSSLIRAHGLHDLPYTKLPWFCNHLPRISTAHIFCVPVCWGAPGFCTNLQNIELSDFTCSTCLNPNTLSVLFAEATQLRSLRIGPLTPFRIPDGYVLRSESLQALDVEFFRASFAGDGVTCTSGALHPTGLISFTAYGDLGEELILYSLFNSMPLLRSLDLASSYLHVFSTYCSWAYSRIRLGRPNPSSKLKTLALPQVRISSAVEMVRINFPPVAPGDDPSLSLFPKLKSVLIDPHKSSSALNVQNTARCLQSKGLQASDDMVPMSVSVCEAYIGNFRKSHASIT